MAIEALDLANGASIIEGIVLDNSYEINACKEALEQPAQEPYRCYWVEKGKGHCERNNRMGLPDSYTHLHQWQGLTDDEIHNIADYSFPFPSEMFDEIFDFARAIEQELKTKNGFSGLKDKNA
jgi:hypothetical protein